jgi:hypothetical protein
MGGEVGDYELFNRKGKMAAGIRQEGDQWRGCPSAHDTRTTARSCSEPLEAARIRAVNAALRSLPAR